MKRAFFVKRRGRAILAALVVVLGCWAAGWFGSHAQVHPALRALPPDLLWAWERAEDLRWLPKPSGVAYVAASVWLEGDLVRVSPRANPLRVRPDTPLVPVVHVDASWRNKPALTVAQRQAVVAQVLRAAHAARNHVVQLDFEVRQSQRAFLQQVVSDIRQQLPPDTALSMTALASWCAGDYWLGAMQADEVVPMAFRMGGTDGQIRAMLSARGGFGHGQCNAAIGHASDEPQARSLAPRRYYFSPKAWTLAGWESVKIQTGRWP